MLADPQVLTINAVATNFPRVSIGTNEAAYATADGLLKVTTKQNTSAARFRREFRVSQTKIAVDPIGANNINVSKGMSVYLVIDEPRAGFSDIEIGYLIDALKAWATNANYLKILGGEL